MSNFIKAKNVNVYNTDNLYCVVITFVLSICLPERLHSEITQSPLCSSPCGYGNNRTRELSGAVIFDTPFVAHSG